MARTEGWQYCGIIQENPVFLPWAAFKKSSFLPESSGENGLDHEYLKPPVADNTLCMYLSHDWY